MTQTDSPDTFESVEVHYYQEGIFIKSIIDLSKYGIKEENYGVPITVVATEKFGLKIMHGLYIWNIDKVNYQDLALNSGTLMMNNKNYSWVIFIPYINFRPADRYKSVVSPLQVLHNESYEIYEFSDSSFTYGLGVE